MGPCFFFHKETTEETGPSWQNMPSEWWYNVVRHLSYSDRAALALTCRRLSMIVANRVNWRTIRIERYQCLSDTALMQIGRKKPKHLHFEYCSGEGITEGGKHCFFFQSKGTEEDFSCTGHKSSTDKSCALHNKT